MRLPNGYGSVFKVEGRRNPWRAVTAGPGRRHVGYFATRKEAVKALNNLVEKNPTTVKEVYDKWSSEKYGKIVNSRYYEKAFERLAPIWDRKLAELKLADLEKMLRQTDCSAGAKSNIKLLLHQLYEWAMKHDIVQKNYSVYLDAPVPKAKKKTPFSKEEIQVLFDDFSETAQMVLVSIYSGWRPGELVTFTIDGDLMKGGSKTEAGRDRIVPIHPKIKDFVREYRITYFTYRKHFNKLMEELGMSHTPHECRHTFVTMAKEKEINDNIIKLLVGHQSGDVTEGIYTHRTIDSLRRAIAKIDWE